MTPACGERFLHQGIFALESPLRTMDHYACSGHGCRNPTPNCEVFCAECRKSLATTHRRNHAHAMTDPRVRAAITRLDAHAQALRGLAERVPTMRAMGEQLARQEQVSAARVLVSVGQDVERLARVVADDVAVLVALTDEGDEVTAPGVVR